MLSSRWHWIFLAVVTATAACSNSSVAEQPTLTTAALAVATSTSLVTTTSTVAPTTTTEPPPPTFPPEESAAFLEGCISDSSLVELCECALAAVAEGVPGVDLGDLEAEFLASGEFPSAIREAIAECAETELSG